MRHAPLVALIALTLCLGASGCGSLLGIGDLPGLDGSAGAAADSGGVTEDGSSSRGSSTSSGSASSSSGSSSSSGGDDGGGTTGSSSGGSTSSSGGTYSDATIGDGGQDSTVIDAGSDGLSAADANVNDSGVVDSGADVAIEAGGDASIDVQDASDASTDVGLAACPADATATAGQFLISYGSVIAAVGAPVTLDFGDVPVGTTSQQPVTITNLGPTAAAPRIAGGGADAPFGSVGGCGTLSACGSCQMVYSFTPTTSGSTGTMTSFTLDNVAFNVVLEGAGVSPGSDAFIPTCGPPQIGGYSNVCATNSSGTNSLIAALPGPCWCTPTCECLLAQAAQLNYCQYTGSGTPTGCTWVDGSACNSTVLAVVTCQ